MDKVTTVKIAGPAGTGIKSAGLLLAKMLTESGYNFKDYSEYPSLVRGGHNTYQVSFSSGEVYSVHKMVDIFVSLVPGHWQEHQDEFDKNTLIFTDNEGKNNIPFGEMCEQLGGTIYSNTISLGLISFLLDLDKNKNTKILNQANLKKPTLLEVYESLVEKHILEDIKIYPKSIKEFKEILR